MASIPKAIQLFNLLDVSELVELKRELVNHKRLRLLVLSENILKLKPLTFGEKEKKSLFKKLFEEVYTPKKDYLLRNEFRLFTQHIEQILVQGAIKKEVEKNDTSFHYYLLKTLQEKKALQLFKKEYSDTYEKAVEHEDYYAAHNITGLNFVNFTQFLNLKDKDLPYVEKLNELKLHHLSCYYLTEFRQTQIDEQFIYNSLFPFSSEGNHLEKQVAVDFKPFETDYSDYLFLKAKSYLDAPSDRVVTLKKCLTLAEHHLIKNETLFEKEVKFCLATLAKTHILLSEFDDANHYYKLFFERETDKESVERLTVLGYFIANLINQNCIQQAIIVLEENSTYMEKIPRLALWQQCLKIACYAFEENVPKIEESLPKTFTDYNLRTKYFFRFYYAIHANLENRLEAAYREIENLRHQTANKEGITNLHEVVNFFLRYFYTLQHYPKKEKKSTQNLQNLALDMQAFSIAALPETRSYFPFLWLKRKLQEYLV